MGLLIGEIDNANAFQPIFTFGNHGMPRKKIEVIYLYGKVVRNEFLPVLFLRLIDGSGDDPVILRFIIGAQIKLTSAMVGVVFVVGFARIQQRQRRIGLVGGKEANIGAELAFEIGRASCRERV